jgi:hypothetical protein
MLNLEHVTAIVDKLLEVFSQAQEWLLILPL